MCSQLPRFVVRSVVNSTDWVEWSIMTRILGNMNSADKDTKSVDGAGHEFVQGYNFEVGF
jgi:hypothetical protein